MGHSKEHKFSPRLHAEHNVNRQVISAASVFTLGNVYRGY